ncbi:MAG: hypothetical protein E7589_01280 [Ruminococcaceae bacterium]|nr:hypothetical protein [Oscillospiraceae bacterium]
MYYPQIENESSVRQMLSVFRGYNHNPVIGEGEFSQMENMSSDRYPLLSPRSGRIIYNVENAEALTHEPDFNQLWWINSATAELCRGVPDNYFETHDVGLSKDNVGKHFIVTHGAYAIVFPEMKYYDIAGDEEYGSLEIVRKPVFENKEDLLIIFRNCERDGTIIKYAEDVDNPSLGDYKLEAPKLEKAADGTPLDILSPPCLYKYARVDEGNDQWIQITDTFVSVQLDAATADPRAAQRAWCGDFLSGDYVEFEGFQDTWNEGDSVFFIPWINGRHHIKKVTDDGAFIISGIVGGQTEGDNVCYMSLDPEKELPTVTLIVPNLDYVISCGNRLWGCRYGLNTEKKVVNEIYATKLGDIRRWHTYADGSTADNSWAASVGMPGEFTGAVVYDGRPYFFKENRIFTVYGSDTTEFTLYELVESGIEKGSDKTAAVLNGLLYYKSRAGIIAFNGTSTQHISDSLGNERYSDATAVVHNGKYYVSMKDTNGAYHLFVYDTRYGLWHREDGMHAESFATAKGRLYAVADGQIVCLTPDSSDERVRWYAESGIIGLDSPDRKYISKIAVRMSLASGARVVISVQYDSMGDFIRLYGTESQTFKTFTIPVPLRRHDHMRLRIEGEGDVKIFSISKTLEEGSDI